MTTEPEDNGGESAENQHGGPLVPFHHGVMQGIQAFRQGQLILYTVRGEPKEVQELISQLDADGVDEVIAMISHETRDEPEEAQASDDAAEGTAGEPLTDLES